MLFLIDTRTPDAKPLVYPMPSYEICTEQAKIAANGRVAAFCAPGKP